MRYSASLDADLVAGLRQLTPDDAPPLDTLPVATVRAGIAQQMADLKAARAAGLVPPARPVGHVEDFSIEGPGGALPVRLYQPTTPAPTRPLLLFLHGGGFVICDLDTHDDPCRDLCEALGAVVLSVDYRLAPEHPFPAAVDDTDAALRWAAVHAVRLGADPARITLIGDSAGAALSLAGALRAAVEHGPAVRGVCALYPPADFTCAGSYPSRREKGDGSYGLGGRDIAYFTGLYFPREEDTRHPWASPLLSTDLHRLPPCLLVTAEHDPLRDEGQALAAHIAAAGVPVEHVCYDGLPHGFLNLAGQAKRATAACADLHVRLHRRI